MSHSLTIAKCWQEQSLKTEKQKTAISEKQYNKAVNDLPPKNIYKIYVRSESWLIKHLPGNS